MADVANINILYRNISVAVQVIEHYRKRLKNGQQRSIMILRRILRRRKHNRSVLFSVIQLLLENASGSERRFWVQPSRETGVFWEKIVTLWTDDNLWLENFRMSKDTFEFLCNELVTELHKKDTNFRKAVPVEKRVALCIWHLATGEDFRSLGWRFGVAKSTACTVVNEVCQAITDILMPRIIKWPTGESLSDVIDGFSTWGFPNCAGAIDGTHIPIIAPSVSSSDYYNRKAFYSIVMQAVVDDKYRFSDIYIKWPGKVHDARVLVNSGVYAKGQAGILFPDITKNVNERDIPVLLIGDAAYPLLSWLMRPFQDNGNLSQDQFKFNYRLSRARMVVEGALGRMKCRFRSLLKRNETSLEYLPAKVASCCVLHNLCEMQQDGLPEAVAEYSDNENDNFNNSAVDLDINGQEIRQALTAYFVNN